MDQTQDGRPSNEVALALYERLAELRGVVVRFRGKEFGCKGCLRITVGTSEEVEKLLSETRAVLSDLLNGSISLDKGSSKEKKEQAANNVVA